MWIIGCDLHTRYQQAAAMNDETGEVVELRLDVVPAKLKGICSQCN
jgi:hypothetical protein